MAVRIRTCVYCNGYDRSWVLLSTALQPSASHTAHPSPSPRSHNKKASPSPPIVPLRLGIKPNQALRSDIISDSKQLGYIDIQGAVRFSAGQQLVYTRHGSGDGVGRCPGRLQQVQADLARLEVDVGVAYGRDEANGRGGEGILVGDAYVEKPFPSCGRLVNSALFVGIKGVRGCSFEEWVR